MHILFPFYILHESIKPPSHSPLYFLPLLCSSQIKTISVKRRRRRTQNQTRTGLAVESVGRRSLSVHTFNLFISHPRNHNRKENQDKISVPSFLPAHLYPVADQEGKLGRFPPQSPSMRSTIPEIQFIQIDAPAARRTVSRANTIERRDGHQGE